MFQPETELQERRHRSRGATAVEYALIVALIAGIIIAAVASLGTSTRDLYQEVDTELDNN